MWRIKPGVNTCILHFSPECEHCQKEVNDLLQNYDKFKDTQFVLSSSLKFSEVKAFGIQHNLSAYPNITFAWEPDRIFSKIFKIKYVPFIAIFDKQQHLVKTYDSELKVDEWLKLIN